MEPETRELRARMARNLVKAVYVAGEDLLGKAVNLAPVEEGTLRGSAALAIIVSGRRFEGAGVLSAAQATAAELARRGLPVTVDVEVSFNTVYAARQHEETGWHHGKGGQAKYLSQPFAAAAPRLARLVKAAADHPGDP